MTYLASLLQIVASPLLSYFRETLNDRYVLELPGDRVLRTGKHGPLSTLLLANMSHPHPPPKGGLLSAPRAAPPSYLQPAVCIEGAASKPHDSQESCGFGFISGQGTAL